MEKDKKQNWFNDPVIIIFVIIFVLVVGGNIIFPKIKSNVQTTGENYNNQQIIDDSQDINLSNKEQIKQGGIVKSTSEIVQEWRKSTAYINCEYGSIVNNTYRSISGSGLLVELNSKPTIITNRHVVDNSLGDLHYCDIKFPDQTKIPYMINPENISYNNGNDVAFLDISRYSYSDAQSEKFDKEVRGDQYSITERAQNENYLCQESEKIGDSLVIIGYPIYGNSVDNSTYEYPVEVTVTEGIISGKDGIYYTTSAKTDSGNSGGLAIDTQNDCYFGIPTWNKSGNFESLNRILPASIFLKY